MSLPKALKIVLGCSLLLLVILALKFSGNLFPADFDADRLQANLSRLWVQPKQVEKVLQNYPFPLLAPPVTIAEGFEAYDGNLSDKPGEAHWAVDYVQQSGNLFSSFPVFSAHEGVAFQGYGKTWGKFVVVRKRSGTNFGYNTLYSHLDKVPKIIPFMTKGLDDSEGIWVEAGTHLGNAGTTGNTKGIPQLHFEFHVVDPKLGTTLRADPYAFTAA